MLRTILQMELRTLWRDRWAWGLLLALAALIILATAQGVRWQQQQQKQLSGLEKMDAERSAALLDHLRQQEQSPGSWTTRNDPRLTFEIAQQGRLMTLPTLDTATLAIGHADLLPQLAHISVGQSESSLWNRLEIENPLHARTGRFDLAFVLVFLLPLFLLALTFHLLPGDREQGVISLSLAQSARLAPLLAMRLSVRGVLVLAVVVVAALGTMSFLEVSWRRAENSWRLGWGLVLTTAYTLFWLTLAFVANVHARSAASSALMLATAWLSLAVLFPAVFNAVLVRVCAPPSRVQLVSAIKTATREATQEASQTLASYYQGHPELRPPGTASNEGDFIAKHFATRERTEKDVAPVLQEFSRQLERQQNLIARWQYLLPTVVVDQAFSDLAGTSSRRHAQFRTQVREALAAWQSWFVPKLVQSMKLQSADLEALPRPPYQDETREHLLSRLGPAVGLLLLSATLFITWGVARLRRCPAIA